jgi:hypothetical protein
MTEALERRYRRMLVAYPDSYRQDRGDEIVATLLEMAAPNRRWPAPKEVAGLLSGAARTHIRVNRDRPAREVWAGGLRIAALFLLAQATSLAAIQTGFDLTNLDRQPVAETASFVTATLLCAAALVGVGSGRYWWACAAGLGAFAAQWVGSNGYRSGPATLFTAGWDFSWPIMFALVACAALVVVRPPAGRGFAWLAAIPIAVVLLPNQFNPAGVLQPYASLVFVALCLLSTVVDSRIPIAGAAICLTVAANIGYALVEGWLRQPELLIWFTVPAVFAAILLLSVPLARLVVRRRPTKAI